MAESQNQIGGANYEEFHANLVAKLEAWIAAMEPGKADEVFISCACGEHQETPRSILEGVKQRTADGEAFAKGWWESEQLKRGFRTTEIH